MILIIEKTLIETLSVLKREQNIKLKSRLYSLYCIFYSSTYFTKPTQNAYDFIHFCGNTLCNIQALIFTIVVVKCLHQKLKNNL